MKSIDSSANPRYRALRRLVDSSQERKRTGLSVLDGIHLVAAYLDRAGLPEQAAVSRSGLADPEIAALVENMHAGTLYVLNDALFRNLSSVVTPSGILAVIRTPKSQTIPPEMECCVMLEQVQDPGNLGSILRTCAAAGIEHVLLSKGTAHAWSPRVLRAGMGAHFLLNIYEQIDLLTAARAFRGRLIATRRQSLQPVFDADLTGRMGFLFGNEGAGLSAELLKVAQEVVSIPMAGGTDSLNVASAVAVCLFERVRQLRAKSVSRDL